MRGREREARRERRQGSIHKVGALTALTDRRGDRVQPARARVRAADFQR